MGEPNNQRNGDSGILGSIKGKAIGIAMTALAGLALWFISSTYASVNSLNTWRDVQTATAITVEEWEQVRTALLKASMALDDMAVLPAKIDTLSVRLNIVERDLAVLRAEYPHP